jgi:hypothetical protein
MFYNSFSEVFKVSDVKKIFLKIFHKIWPNSEHSENSENWKIDAPLTTQHNHITSHHNVNAS